MITNEKKNDKKTNDCIIDKSFQENIIVYIKLIHWNFRKKFMRIVVVSH